MRTMTYTLTDDKQRTRAKFMCDFMPEGTRVVFTLPPDLTPVIAEIPKLPHDYAAEQDPWEISA